MITHKILGASYRKIIKPMFFKFDPEFIHNRISVLGGILGSNSVTKFLTRKLFRYDHPSLIQFVKNAEFKNPVGLSAGFDKDAHLVHILPEVGFGHMEIGSITYKPYAGNPGTRLFRLPKSKALVVYYGLKNIGVDKILAKLKKYKAKNTVLGISIAKTNDSSTSTLEGGIEDYYQCFRNVVESGIGTYYTINISCPNTFGGEPFTTKDKLDALLTKLAEIKTDKIKFIKMPINLDLHEFDELLQVAIKHKIDGVVIGNLNKDHKSETIKDIIPQDIKGGISGKPTWELSNRLIEYTYKNYKDKLIIVGVGGIFSAEDAYTKIKLGATLVQLITGMIYQGPQLIGEINKGLVELLKNDGYTNISQAIGASHKN